jgi:hypothetical protein
MKKIDRYYVSEIDKKMAEFNKKHPLSASQQFEHDKYLKIYQARDHIVDPTKDEPIDWGE